MAPTHGRISSSRPSRILRTMCGSAMCARVMPTMSSLPDAIACRAVATSGMRPHGNVGNFVARAHLAREIEMRAALHAGSGMRSTMPEIVLDVASDDVEEVDQARRLEALADLDAFLAWSGRTPRSSSAAMRMPTMRLGADPLADLLQDAQAEPHAVLETTTVVVVRRAVGAATRNCRSDDRTSAARSHRDWRRSSARPHRHSP